MSGAAPAPAAADAARVLAAAVLGAAPHALLARLDWPALAPRPPAAYRRVRVVGAGKAAMAMAGAAERALAACGAPAVGGAVTVPHGYAAAFPAGRPAPARVAVREAGHPAPDAAGAVAAAEALALAADAGADDLVLALVSGGASALWPAPPPGLALADVRAATALLLRAGAGIAEVNAVRKHLSRVAGGRLAAAAAPADVVALVLSDVVGDDPAVIASGPTAPDPSTFADAAGVLRAYALWDAVPAGVRAHLEAGARGEVPETLKPGAPALARVRTVVVGGNADALRAAADAARALGYRPRVVDGAVAGEARDAGRAAARHALDAARQVAAGASPATCLLWGGETTVTVRGRGRGGRNQEAALAAALALDAALHGRAPAGADVAFLAAGTDGIDGPTDAAGACVTPATARRARARGADPAAALADNDAYRALDAAGALLRTGPTHTNVMDVHVALVRPAPARP